MFRRHTYVITHIRVVKVPIYFLDLIQITSILFFCFFQPWLNKSATDRIAKIV